MIINSKMNHMKGIMIHSEIIFSLFFSEIKTWNARQISKESVYNVEVVMCTGKISTPVSCPKTEHQYNRYDKWGLASNILTTNCLSRVKQYFHERTKYAP